MTLDPNTIVLDALSRSWRAAVAGDWAERDRHMAHGQAVLDAQGLRRKVVTMEEQADGSFAEECRP